MDKQKIKGEDYKKIYIPTGAWVLIEKDTLPQKTKSGIIIPDSARVSQTKITGTGTIVSMSSFNIFESEWDRVLHSIYKVGDMVGFSDTTPIMSPAPPDMEFAEECSNRFVTMHLQDILMVFCDTEEKIKEFKGRCHG